MHSLLPAAELLLAAFVPDFSCSGQCTVSLHKAAVWTLLFPPNSHLPGPLLRSGFCVVVPRKVNQCSQRYCLAINQTPPSSLFSSLTLFTRFCIRLPAFTQVTSRSWFLPSSWRAACLCGWARSVSTASGTPSAPTLSWSSALKGWELKLSCSR